MSLSRSLYEHWTDGKSAVVVTAEPTVMSQLLVDLGLSLDTAVNLSCQQNALALWGEELATYLDWRDGSLESSAGDDRSSAGGSR